VGENMKIERGRLQLNLASLSIRGSVKCPINTKKQFGGGLGRGLKAAPSGNP